MMDNATINPLSQHGALHNKLHRSLFDKSSAASGATLSFDALGYDASFESTGVITGIGSLTSTHASSIYSKDHEDVYREVAANGEVWTDGREVTNVLQHSDDVSNAAWLTTGTASKDSASLVTFGSQNARFYQQVSSSYADVGDVVAFRITARSVSGNTGVSLWNDEVDSAFHTPITLTASFQTFCVVGTVTGANLQFGLQDRNASGWGQVEVKNMQVEVLNGRTDQTNPSEYVATTTAAVTKWFANSNGTTVSSNVVTEGVGTALTTQPFLQYQPAITNDCLYSNDLTNASWIATGTTAATLDQVGLTGAANTATEITDNDAGVNAYLRYQHTVPTDTNTHTAKVWIKKDSNVSRFPYVKADCLLGTAQSAGIMINTMTGDSYQLYSVGTNDYKIVDDGDWWIVYVSVTNNNTNTGFRLSLYPALSTTWGVAEVTTTGSCVIGNAEIHEDKTIDNVKGAGCIFTTSAAVSTSETVYDLDVANHSNAAGAAYIEYYPLGTMTTGGHGLYGRHSSGAHTVLGRSGSSLQCSDETTWNNNIAGIATDATNKCASVWSAADSSFDVNLENTWGGTKAYDGDFNTTSNWGVAFNGNAKIAFKLRNLKVYLGSYTAMKTQIDADMIGYITGDSFTDNITDGDGNLLTAA